VVVVTSAAHFQAPGIDWEAVRRPTRSLSGYPEYRVSKLANVLFASELQRRLGGEGLFACSVHPGMAATGIWRPIPQPLRWVYTRRLPSAEEAAAGPLLCCTAPLPALQAGGYHNRGRPAVPSEAARDPRLAAELWEHTMEWLTPYLG
jgi:NAD(P)-dependent dehydrogenase (short-subunit alcohol dehydrogenase family)